MLCVNLIVTVADVVPWSIAVISTVSSLVVDAWVFESVLLPDVIVTTVLLSVTPEDVNTLYFATNELIVCVDDIVKLKVDVLLLIKPVPELLIVAKVVKSPSFTLFKSLTLLPLSLELLTAVGFS